MSLTTVYKTDSPILALPPGEDIPRQVGKDPIYSPQGQDSPEYVHLELAAGATGTVYLRMGDRKARFSPMALAALAVIASPIITDFTVGIDVDTQVEYTPVDPVADPDPAYVSPAAAVVTWILMAPTAHVASVPFQKAFYIDPLAAPGIFCATEIRVKVTNDAITAAKFRVSLISFERNHLHKI